MLTGNKCRSTQTPARTHMNVCAYLHAHTFVCVCVRVCVCA